MLEDRGEPPTTHPPGDLPSPWPASYPQGYAVVDVETTGLGKDDRIVSAAVYRLDARGRVEDHWYSLVNPERDPGPVWIHGLTSERLAGAPLFREIAGKLDERLAGRVLVAHNAAFDWAMLAREYARAERRAPVEHRLCTILLAKVLELPLANHRLETLAAHYGVAQRQAHHALDDARVLAEAFRPSLHLAAAAGLALPLHACRPLSAWAASPVSAGPSRGGRTPGGWRRTRGRPPCPYPNPGRWEPGGPLVQGMRVAFSGDTSVDRELLEDTATEAGLHVASAVSRLTSLLVTNDPGAYTTKAVSARRHGTPVVDEARFRALLEAVAPTNAAGGAGAAVEVRSARVPPARTPEP